MAKKTTAAAAIIGTAVGVAAGAAAVGLSNKKNREKVSKMVDDLTKKAQKFTKELNSNPDVKQVKRMGKKTLKDVQETAKPAIRAAKQKTKN